MPQTITKQITAYKFQELSGKAKQEVCYALAPNDYEWWDHIYDQAKEEATPLGFSIHHIYFTGFYSQGDGASWTGYVDMVRWLEKNKPNDANAHIMLALMEEGWIEKQMVISTSGRYQHSNTMQRGELYSVAPDADAVFIKGMFAGLSVANLIEALPCGYLDDIADEALHEARRYADDIFYKLRHEYDHLCSPEVIEELCDANEYLFTEHGKFV